MNKIFKSIVMVALMLVSVSAMGQYYGKITVTSTRENSYGTAHVSSSNQQEGDLTFIKTDNSNSNKVDFKLYAHPNTGFTFLGWSIDGGATLLPVGDNQDLKYTDGNYIYTQTISGTSDKLRSEVTLTAVIVPEVKVNGSPVTIGNTNTLSMKDNTLEITDAGDIESFVSSGIYDDLNIQYTRNFEYNNGQENVHSTDWQPWFVPFKFNTGNAPEGVSFAKLAGAFTDLRGNLYVAYLKVQANKTIKANTPYLVKSKTNSSVTFSATTLEALEATPVVIQSSDQIFTFNGTYATQSGDGKSGEKYYALKADEDGRTIFADLGDNSVNAFRYIMTQSERTDKLYPDYTAPSSSSAPVRVVVYDDQEDLADAIKAVKGRWIDAEGFYDLTGRKVQPGKVKGFFINGGKKYFSR